ncbi:MAG: hypothetical protein DSY87_09510 [Methylococcus sp.]|nr:MAG: hypothetical protein DSY87_09510 [Methylococcus sp.]
MLVDTLINSRWIIPVEPHDLILEHHSIAILNGQIVELLPTEEALSKYQAGSMETLNDHVLIPGLINCHTHSPMSFLRGIADDLPLMEWLQSKLNMSPCRRWSISKKP